MTTELDQRVEQLAQELAQMYAQARRTPYTSQTVTALEVAQKISAAEKIIPKELRKDLRPRMFEILGYPTDPAGSARLIESDFPGLQVPVK